MVADLPSTGATSMTTEAKAERTCCEESAASSFTQGTTALITLSAASILQIAETLPAAATLTSASVSRSSLTYAGTNSVLQLKELQLEEHSLLRSLSMKDTTGCFQHAFKYPCSEGRHTLQGNAA